MVVGNIMIMSMRNILVGALANKTELQNIEKSDCSKTH